VILYPIVFLPVLRLWSVSRANGYVTPADYVRGRHGSSTLALLIAITGIVATMPYIALQLAGLEAVLRTMGLNGSGLAGHLPLFIAFVILAVYTYQSGLRAPALIAFVKDILIYLVILVAVFYLPSKLGGWGHIFDVSQEKLSQTNPKTGKPYGSIVLAGKSQLQYATLALGSALALFLYPHSLTSVFASRGRNVLKRNMIALPAYSLVLGLLALLGYAALSAGIKPIENPATGKADSNTIVPLLFDSQFSSWFAGIAFAAIGIGALVPAAIMSIAAANLWTRNIYKEYINRSATPRQEAGQAKIASLVVKFGAVALIVLIDPAFSIDLQLIGGVIILQTLPAVAIALYTRWFHRIGLITGWIVGMAWGLIMLYNIPSPKTGKGHFGGTALPLGKLSIFGWHPFDGVAMQIYPGIVSLVANLLVAIVVTMIVRAFKVPDGPDSTHGEDYHVDEDDADLRPIGAH
jgi:SSS family solute:Na+ symporter